MSSVVIRVSCLFKTCSCRFTHCNIPSHQRTVPRSNSCQAVFWFSENMHFSTLITLSVTSIDQTIIKCIYSFVIQATKLWTEKINHTANWKPHTHTHTQKPSLLPFSTPQLHYPTECCQKYFFPESQLVVFFFIELIAFKNNGSFLIRRR